MVVNRLIDGRAAPVEERGHGPNILIVGEVKAVSALASSLAKRHRVIVAPPTIFGGPGHPALPSVLDSLGVAGDTTIVASGPTTIRLLESLDSVTDRVIRLAALDVDRDALDTADVRRLFNTRWAHMFVLASPSSPAWNYYRSTPAGGGTSVSIVEACGDGLTPSCARELSPLLGALTDAPSWPGTGTVFQDTTRAAASAPPVVVVPNGQLQTSWRGDGTDARAAVSSLSVNLTRRIAVAVTETTVSEFRRFVEATGYQPEKGCWFHTVEQEWRFHENASWSAPVFSQTDTHPVTCVTHEDAQAYVAWLSGQTGRRYRLPTEVEFEFVNRGGRSGPYGFDIDRVTQLCEKVNGADRSSGFAYANQCGDGFAFTAPAGSFPANDFGLYDTTGNLWELTADCWQSDYVRAAWNLLGRGPRDGSARNLGSCPGRHVVRGGAFISSPNNLRVLTRDVEGYRSTRVGFRVVRELP